MRLKTIHAVLLIGVSIVTVTLIPCRAQSWRRSSNEVLQSLEERLVGKTVTLRVVPNNCSKIYVETGGGHYHCIHEKSRLFPAKIDVENVTIESVDRGPSAGAGPQSKRDIYDHLGSTDTTARGAEKYIRVRLRHAHLGRGAVRIQRQDGEAPEEVNDIIEALAYALEIEGVSSPPPFVGNKDSKCLHYAGCNHLPERPRRDWFESIESAQAQGYILCPLCFDPVPGVTGYVTEKMLGEQTAATVRYYYPLTTNEDLQNRVRRVGETVLRNWPTSLKGYYYRFYVIDSDAMNAVACPAGKVFVSDTLLKSLESNEELEAVLAHEITHIEKRHGYRQYRTAQTVATIGAILTLGAAAAAASDSQDAAAITAGVSGIMVALASNIALAGYSRGNEQEADMYALMYLLKNGKNRERLGSAFRKLSYSQDRLGLSTRQASLFSTHPDLDERIFIAENVSIRPLEEPFLFEGWTKDGDAAATLSCEAQFLYTDKDGKRILTLLAEVETSPALEKESKVKSILLMTDRGNISMNNRENTPIEPNDTVGISFEASARDIDFFDTIYGIELSLGPITRWTRLKQPVE